MKPVGFDSRAEAEVEEAVSWYESRRLGLGEDFRQELESALGRVQRNPSGHPLCDEEASLRMCLLNRFPYTLIFREQEDRILILAVAHQRRKPGYWADRI